MVSEADVAKVVDELVADGLAEVVTSAETVPDVWPVTIVRARYQGSYEPGKWLAFPLHPDGLPDDWQGDDVSCGLFWGSYEGPVGAGSAPARALADLARKLEANRG